MRFSRWHVVFVFSFLFAATAFGQGPPSDTCDGDENLTGADTLPVNLQSLPTIDFFTGCGTIFDPQALGPDHVTCFTPANSCELWIQCESQGPQIVVSVCEGPCTAFLLDTCFACAGGTDMATLEGVHVTAGTQYCVLCEADPTLVFPLQISIAAWSAQDCGALPMVLKSFRVE